MKDLIRAYFSCLPHQSLNKFVFWLDYELWSPKGLNTAPTFYAYMLFLSPAFHYRGMKHCYISHSSALFFPDVSCSSLSCCAGEWALIAQKFLIKKQYWAKPKWYFANFIVYMTAFSASIYNLFLIYRTVPLLIFLFLLLISKEKSISQSLDMTFPSGNIRPNWIPIGLRMAGLFCPRPLLVVCVGLQQRCWSTLCQKGLAQRWTGRTAGMCPPQHTNKSWHCIRVGQWAHFAAVQGQAAFWDNLNFF